MNPVRTLAPLGLAAALSAVACSKAPPPPPVGPVAPAIAPPITVQWSTDAEAYRGQLGQTLTITCPPNGSPDSVWGSDLYSDDSSICTAALHSGRVTLAQGGTVQIVIAAGAPAYVATTRNGVSTAPWGPWTGSFTIVGGPAPGLVAVPVTAPSVANATDWSTDGSTVAPGTTSAVATCPPNGTADNVWGTDVYTGDSSFCTAAVHAGVITLAAGGPVRVTGVPGLPSYVGSTHNGVTSEDWPTYPNAFRVEAAR